jgi:hypothetical protein
MLGSLPGLFDKNFAIAFLLPAFLALAGAAWLFPGTGLLEPLRSLTANEKSLESLTYLVLLAYGGAIALLTTGTWQYRFLKGYIAPISRLEPLRARHRAKRTALSDEVAQLLARWNAEREAFPVEDQRRTDTLKRRLIQDYPPLTQDVMPTRFGNVIRAFESYPLQVYGADGPPLWLRLSAVIPKDFAAELQDARGLSNCLLNLLYLAAAFAFAAFAAAVARTPWPDVLPALTEGSLGGWRVLPEALAGLCAVALLPLLYHSAVDRAGAWGEAVKAAFDCFLPALVEQLGYAAPRSEAERRAFWTEVNALVVYRQPISSRRVRFADAPAPEAPAPSRLLPSLIGPDAGSPSAPPVG